ncbi:DNA-3-methyladenine glycosidase [Pasteurellaceae bacterium RH1A]|nr:DNA-3-methyladenine glycosidase [Pasteurellaceae bacterium RH1A]
MNRCTWCGTDPLYQAYHDQEWGRPEYNPIKLFEKICLEGQQAGLSWITVLKKREAYRAAFFQFDPEKIAGMTEVDLDKLMENPGLIRHRKKLQAIITNAKAYLAMQAAGQDFSQFVWGFVNHQPQINDVPHLAAVPAQTQASEALSKALKKQGFSFVGPTTCYAFMQSMGLVDDHLNDCFCKGKE